MTKLKICYLPGREFSYSRTRIFLKGMTEAGIDVYDCSGSGKGFFAYVSGFLKFLMKKGKCDIVLVGFMGHTLMPLVKLFTRKKIIFDAFISIYQTLVFDRGVLAPGSLFAGAARFIDRFACSIADLVLLDTDQHIEYFVREFKLDKNKFRRIPAGADDSVMYPRDDIEGGEFLVHFHGEYQALHGAGYIIEAASMLWEARFQLIGRGREFEACRKEAEKRGLKNVTFVAPVSYDRLPEYMARATVCLGIFGGTEKAAMVIPNKVYEALAMGKAVITSDTPAVRELLTDGENVLLCGSRDAESLTLCIKKLRNNAILRKRIADGGYDLFRKKCLPRHVGREIIAACETIKRSQS
ncbi:MAG: glycosyltransferase [Candidatus Omnitrophica bacterium]|nr:glycosyltransferase [Candidatus Omnitrophota bacterium]MBU1784226.1 glycosyltransferase [Candidatus Omnitrophota bacterium]